MMKRVVNLRKEIIFQDTETGKIYRRVIGALGWPWEPKPGFMVVIGERNVLDQGLKGRPLEVLAEREVQSIADLHRGCRELRKQWACDTWLANLEQKEALRLFRKLNQEIVGKLNQENVGPEPIRLAAAPYSQGDGQMQTLFQMLGMVQSPERKLLSYGSGSKLPGYGMGLDARDLQQPAIKFPQLAALGYAVAEMILREPWSGNEAAHRVVNNWDRFNI